MVVHQLLIIVKVTLTQKLDIGGLKNSTFAEVCCFYLVLVESLLQLVFVLLI